MWKHLNKSQDGPCERTPTESESFQKGIRSQSNPVVLFYSSFSNWPVNITAFEVPEWHTYIKNFPNKSSLSASLKLQSFTNDGYVCNCTHHTPSGFSAIVWELFTGTYSTCFLLLSLWCSMPYLSRFLYLSFALTLYKQAIKEHWPEVEKRDGLFIFRSRCSCVRRAAVCCLSELADITVSSSNCSPYVSCKYIVSGSLFFTSSTVLCILPLASTSLLIERNHIL